jgi:hypothetical protein
MSGCRKAMGGVQKSYERSAIKPRKGCMKTENRVLRQKNSSARTTTPHTEEMIERDGRQVAMQLQLSHQRSNAIRALMECFRRRLEIHGRQQILIYTTMSLARLSSFNFTDAASDLPSHAGLANPSQAHHSKRRRHATTDVSSGFPNTKRRVCVAAVGTTSPSYSGVFDSTSLRSRQKLRCVPAALPE